ncbi:hypothetical protein SELMODRAFT_427360 [Selaginella moellendorffii]|uniref:Methionyl/Valyl/Leucyl/Isoleucyl-tRNA synthetase anticodon-binding domain-containing protein n=1 Tax=Selaginella moellendorffii TaxID=88036 RepID=D8SZB8_SELML|nr:hypothetical protein SELMODRAFT_427360 [Selaginella moellendorffii]
MRRGAGVEVVVPECENWIDPVPGSFQETRVAKDHGLTSSDTGRTGPGTLVTGELCSSEKAPQIALPLGSAALRKFLKAVGDFHQEEIGQLASVVDSLKDSLDEYQFGKFFQSVQQYAVLDLSKFYLEILKDRLYLGGYDSSTRRSCQTVLIEYHQLFHTWQRTHDQKGSKAESASEAWWTKLDP